MSGGFEIGPPYAHVWLTIKSLRVYRKTVTNDWSVGVWVNATVPRNVPIEWWLTTVSNGAIGYAINGSTVNNKLIRSDEFNNFLCQSLLRRNTFLPKRVVNLIIHLWTTIVTIDQFCADSAAIAIVPVLVFTHIDEICIEIRHYLSITWILVKSLSEEVLLLFWSLI